jgi:N-formylglutamate deformylase
MIHETEDTRHDTEAELEQLAQSEGEQPVMVRRYLGSDEVPVVFDSPHSGRFYPEDFRPAVSLDILREYEDRFVDRLVADAPNHGVTLLAANFPRAYIDPNRAPDDLDAEMLEAVWPEPIAPTNHTVGGTGLVFRVMRDTAPIYDRQLALDEVRRRLDQCWIPYHEALKSALAGHIERHGAVWHLNCHSMRPVGDASSPDPDRKRADFVLGDLFGASCAPEFTEVVAETLKGLGYSVAVNEPYSGAYIVARHGRPGDGSHSLQMEINRGLYMDLATLEETDGFAPLRADLGRLAEAVAGFARERVSGGA